MSDTLLRQWKMLSMIPRSPRKIETATLESMLENAGYKITRRTIQRDLEKLSDYFPLMCDDKNTPYGWSWMKSAEVFDIPGIEPNAAVAFSLAEQYLSKLLPQTTVEHLQPYFKAARGVLNTKPDGLGSWKNKVRIVPQGQTLEPPKTNLQVIDVIYEALLDNRQFDAKYLPRDSDKIKNYNINPLGLVFRQNSNYLLATSDESMQVKQFALHRFKSANLNNMQRNVPANFNIDHYINAGGFDYGAQDKEIQLEVAFDPYVAIHLEESPLSKDQQISEMKDGRKLIKARVKDTSQLRWWLFGFADQVEVIKPVSLRNEMKERISTLLARYN